MAQEESHGLEERRDQLTDSLAGLSRQRADSYRQNSDALALGRAGVKQQHPEEMARLGEAEVAADAAIRDAQRELREIDAEIDRRPRKGLGAKLGRVFGRDA